MFMSYDPFGNKRQFATARQQEITLLGSRTLEHDSHQGLQQLIQYDLAGDRLRHFDDGKCVEVLKARRTRNRTLKPEFSTFCKVCKFPYSADSKPLGVSCGLQNWKLASRQLCHPPELPSTRFPAPSYDNEAPPKTKI